MKKYVFIWQDDDLNMNMTELPAIDANQAWSHFLALYPDQGCIAVLSGSDIIVEDFQE